MTFFIGNLTSFIFGSDFFSLSCLGTKLDQVIGEKPVFEAEMGILGIKHRFDFGQFCIISDMGDGVVQFCGKKFRSSIFL